MAITLDRGQPLSELAETVSLFIDRVQTRFPRSELLRYLPDPARAERVLEVLEDEGCIVENEDGLLSSRRVFHTSSS
jgi:hypothetical protein